ncbi:telomerase Cajal body protein 1 homolog [Chrysoperla carnea]|uniref:telomerase Cajal body protein 1 homolog n=1 Tax=Chrysoperla carnea TaxID=189513 RepID=UPI001D0742E6|nr:telomerase Cajal body protein 1 homolog [Chrysoperla carnea]
MEVDETNGGQIDFKTETANIEKLSKDPLDNEQNNDLPNESNKIENNSEVEQMAYEELENVDKIILKTEIVSVEKLNTGSLNNEKVMDLDSESNKFENNIEMEHKGCKGFENDKANVSENQDNENSALEINEKTSIEEHNEELISSSLYLPQYNLENRKNFNQIGYIEYPNDDQQNYIRGCKWSPDGTCLLYAVRGDGMAVIELPTTFYNMASLNTSTPSIKLKPVLKIPENALLYDFCWYPGMDSQDPATCCWLTSCQHAPVQLWDAFTGQLRCTYRGYDLVDEVEAALSVNFSTDGQQIYCGYRKALRTFNVDRPGRDSTYYKLSYPVTCIATNFSQTGQIALGSWNKTIELVDDRLGTIRTIKKLTGHFGGITHLKFSPDGTCLYSGARKDNELICWDLRSPGRPLFSVYRLSDTNQRIYFDISPCGSLIFSAGTNGFVRIWNLLENSFERSSKFKEYEIPVHDDSVNSISVHPYWPIIATGSGQHHFFNTHKEYIDDDLFEIKNIENSVKLWWLGKVDEAETV